MFMSVHFNAALRGVAMGTLCDGQAVVSHGMDSTIANCQQVDAIENSCTPRCVGT